MLNRPSCNTPLTLTLAAEPAKVERGWVIRHADQSVYGHFGWSYDLSQAIVSPLKPTGTPYEAVEVHRINGEWRLVDAEPKPAKVAESKVIQVEAGDWWSEFNGHLWLNRGDFATSVFGGDFGTYKPHNRPKHTRLSDSEGDARAAALGYVVKRTPLPIEKPAEAKVETKFDPEFDRLMSEWENGSGMSRAPLVAVLDNLNARLAKVEGKNGTN